MKFTDVTTALFCCLLWGGNAVVNKIAVQDMPPLLLTLMRFAVALPLLFFFPLPRDKLKPLWWVGIFTGAQFALMNLSLYMGLPAGILTLIMQMGMVVTALLCWYLKNNPPGRNQIIGGLVSITGIAVLCAGAMQSVSFLSLSLAIVAAVCYGATNYNLKAAPKSSLGFTVWSNALTFSVLVPVNAFCWQGMGDWSWALGGCIFYSGILANLAGATVWTKLMTKYEAHEVMQYTATVPIFGVMASVVFLGETFTKELAIAGALVVLGLLISQGKLKGVWK